MDPYIVVLLGFGGLVVMTAWLPLTLTRAPLSMPIVFVAIGAALFALPTTQTEIPHPGDHLGIVERFAEFVVIISLFSAGLKLDRRIGWARWILAWRLLGIAMPLTILLLAVAGWSILGLGLASALLLAAALAPTDPVLASDIQVGPPNSGEEGETRFALTSEAGLNDALAFPFVHAALALALAATTGEPWLMKWFTIDVLWKLAAGIVIGAAGGYVMGLLLFHLPNRARLSRTGDGFVALGITCLAYASTELAHGYGFLAVFVAGLAIRAREREHKYHQRLHDFAEELERLLTMALLVAFGGALTSSSLLHHLGWMGALFGLLAIFVVRPLCGWLSLVGAQLPNDERAVISFYGIRGVGSVYYLAYAFGHGEVRRRGGRVERGRLHHPRFDFPAWRDGDARDGMARPAETPGATGIGDLLGSANAIAGDPAGSLFRERRDGPAFPLRACHLRCRDHRHLSCLRECRPAKLDRADRLCARCAALARTGSARLCREQPAATSFRACDRDGCGRHRFAVPRGLC